MAADINARKDSFDLAMAKYGPGIQATVRSMVKNQGDIEDVVAEVNLAVWMALPSFNGRSSFKTFIHSIVRHKIMDHFRQKYRDLNLLRKAAEAIREQGDPRDFEPAPKIRLLTSTELVVLRLISKGLKNTEIAEILFRSTNTIRSHVKKINKKLGTTSRANAAYIFGHCGGK